MHICIIFYNLGGYHLARLQAAKSACNARGWDLNAIQIAGQTSEHPWGDLAVPNYVTTLSSHQAGNNPNLEDQSLLTGALDALSPDAVAIPGWGFDFARSALRWCRQRGCLRILMSESKYDDEPRNPLKELAKRYLAVNKFDAALVGGSKHENYLVRLGFPRNKIFRGYDVVDNDYFQNAARRFRDQATAAMPECVHGRKYLLAANRFIERKNLSRLIDAFKLSISDGQPESESWDLVLLGGGTKEPQLRTQVIEHGLSGRVHFPGFIGYSEMPRWYAFASAFIHPALSEQWGLVVNEAMASGLPILLSRACGCYPELLHEGENGYSFDPHDTQQIADAITRIKSGLPAVDNRSREIIGRFDPTTFGEGLASAITCISPSIKS